MQKKQKLKYKKQQQKKRYDKNAHDLTELRKGDQVTVQNQLARTNIGKRQLSQKSLNTGNTWSNWKMEKD